MNPADNERISAPALRLHAPDCEVVALVNAASISDRWESLTKMANGQIFHHAFITTTVDAWAAMPESHDPTWDSRRHADLVTAWRIFG